LVETVTQALHGAPDAFGFLQVREQTPSDVGPATDTELEDLLLEFAPICAELGVKLVCNRRVDLVEELELDGVHLGARTEKVGQTRRVLGNDAIIGYSAHAVDEAQEALRQGADYVFLSPVFDPKSKPSKVPPLGIDPLKDLCAKTAGPVFALGGVDVSNIGQCRDVGAVGVGMISSLLNADDPAKAAAELAAAWRRGS
jgi:thiamine-phosphate pyrophosphorylase